jgi:hypothetical protein
VNAQDFLCVVAIRRAVIRGAGMGYPTVWKDRLEKPIM